MMRLIGIAVAATEAFGISSDVPTFDGLEQEAKPTEVDLDRAPSVNRDSSACGISDNGPSSDGLELKAEPRTEADTDRSPSIRRDASEEDDTNAKIHRFEAELWEFARQQGMVCQTEEEAIAAAFMMTHGIAADVNLLLLLILSPNVDIDTKVLSHMFLYELLWAAVDGDSILLPSEVLDQIESMCANNVASKNWGIFRGAVRVLAELGLLLQQKSCEKISQSCISSDMLVRLLNFLRIIFTLPKHPVFDSFSSSLPSQGCRASWGTHVGFDILLLVKAYLPRLSWEQLVQCQYLKTLVLIWGSDSMEVRHRPKYVVNSIWDEWPIADISFHKFLRDSVRAVTCTTNAIELTLLNVIGTFLLRGIQLISFPVKYEYPVFAGNLGEISWIYDISDKGVQLSCTCIGNLLEEIFVASHKCSEYFSEFVDMFQKDIQVECFSENISLTSSDSFGQKRGVFFGHDGLRPVVDFSLLSSSLNERSGETQQLVALYILRGLSLEDLSKHVEMDVYLSALRRYPDTLAGAWFHRRINPIEFELENQLAHCAASIDNTDCLNLYGGDMNLLVEGKKKNSLLHTAAFHGSANVARLLLERGMLACVRNQDHETPLMVARRRKNRACVSILQSVSSEANDSIDSLVATIEAMGPPLAAATGVATKGTKQRKSKKKRKKKKCPKTNASNAVSQGDDDTTDDRVSSEMKDSAMRNNALDASAEQVISIKLPLVIAKEIFAAQRELPEHENIVKVLSCEIRGDEGVLLLEAVHGTLDSIIPVVFSGQSDTQAYSFFRRLSWCRQLLSAIKEVHLHRAHGNVDATNIFYSSSRDGEFTMKLGPVADRMCLSRTVQTRNVFYSPVPLSSFTSKTGADIFAAGCVLSLLLCGHHIYGLESTDQVRNMENHNLFNKSRLKEVSVEAFDLVKRMVEGGLVDADTCLGHPVFWNASKRFSYISELVRTENHLCLPSDEKLGLGRDWRSKLRPDGALALHMRASPSFYGGRPSDFLRLCRNFYQHPPKDYRDNCDPLDDASLELQTKFPSLFPDLFAIFGVEEVLR